MAARFKHTPDVLYNLIEGPTLPKRFKALQDMGGAEGLAKALCTDLRKGLSKAEVSEERKRRSALRCLCRSFSTCIALCHVGSVR
jgi:hypothetical protein